MSIMRRGYFRRFALLAGLALYSLQAAAEIELIDGWSRASPPGAKSGAVYGLIKNEGLGVSRIVSIQTEVADSAEIHDMKVEQGMMRMRSAMPVEVAPDSDVLLQPGGLHLMLMGLEKPLKSGESFRVILITEAGKEVSGMVKIGKVSQMGFPVDPHQGHH